MIKPVVDQPAGGLAPLYLLAGAPAAGKTTLLPYLLRAADGLVVMDMDELLEDGALLGVTIADPRAALVWPAYDRLWARIVTMVRRAGHPVLLLCPVPDPPELHRRDGGTIRPIGPYWTAPTRCDWTACGRAATRESGSRTRWRTPRRHAR